MACNTGTGHGFYISGSQGTKSSGGTPYITHYNYKIQGGEEVMPGSGFDQIMEFRGKAILWIECNLGI